MATAVAYKVVTSETSLNMREEANTTSKVVASVPKGSVVNPILVVPDKNGFAYVSYAGQTGWCSLSYLVPVDASGNEVVNTTTTDKKEEDKKDCNGKAWLIAGGIIFAIGASMNIFM